MTSFQPLIQMIQDGKPVNAATTNVPLEALSGNITYLRDLIATLGYSSRLIAQNKLLASSVLVGQAVYYNAVTQQFEATQPGVELDAQGNFVTTTATHAWGLVLSKSSATCGDILLYGNASLSLANAVTGTVTPGLYYLSATTAGKLTATPPAVPVPICLVAGQNADGTCDVFVQNSFRDALENHRHYKFELQCVEAGTSAEEGWLPGANAIFGGKAPAGAVYGYNLSVSSLQNLWPPIPPDNAYLEWHTGLERMILGMSVPSGNDGTALVYFDSNGIWWMSDCTDDQPWAPVSSLSIPSEDCGRALSMRMYLWFTRPVFWSEQSAVLSLTTAADSGLTITCVNDAATTASTGHLQIDANLALTVNSTATTAGHLAFKGLSDKSFQVGPVVEGIKAGSSNITLTSDIGELPASGIAQGVVTISVATDLEGSELPVQTVRLDGVTEEYYEDVIALGFAAAVDSSLRGRFQAPSRLDAATSVKLRFRFMGRSAGTLPSNAFTLSYRRIPAPSATLTLLALPTADTALSLNTGITFTTANQYFDVLSEAITVQPGDTVLYSLSRGDSDGYAAQVQLLAEAAVVQG